MCFDIRDKVKKIKLVVIDFDGTLTDGKVTVDQNGVESVTCSRKDGMGILLLNRTGLKVVVVSSGHHEITKRRCEKLEVKLYQTVGSKINLLYGLLREYSVDISEVAFMGDDVNDLECLKMVGVAIAVADGCLEIRNIADYITKRNGGDHAVREACDWILEIIKSA